jgi:hypothetical protein
VVASGFVGGCTAKEGEKGFLTVVSTFCTHPFATLAVRIHHKPKGTFSMRTLLNMFPARLQSGVALCCALLLVGLTACLPAKTTTLPEVLVEIGDAAIKTPATMPAGLVAVTFKDLRTQPKDGVPIIARLHDGVTMNEALAADEDPTAPPKMTFLGGHMGRTIFNLAAGNYFIQWASPEENSGPPAVPFSVQGETGPLVEPTADVQLELHEFNFTLPDSVPSGKHLWRISNQGKLTHHALFWKLNEGVSDKEFTAWVMQAEPQGPPPATLVVDWAPIESGVTSWAELELPVGSYYLICFLPDFSTNPPQPHLAHGMIRKFTVQ